MSFFSRLFSHSKGNPFMSTAAVQDIPKAVPESHAHVHPDVPTAVPAASTSATQVTGSTAPSLSTTIPGSSPGTAALATTAVAALTATEAAPLSATTAAAVAPAKAGKPGQRPVDQIHADIVAAQAQHAQLRAQAQTISATVTGLKKQQTGTADRLRSLRAELQSAASAIASSVENDIAEVESFFQRLVKEL